MRDAAAGYAAPRRSVLSGAAGGCGTASAAEPAVRASTSWSIPTPSPDPADFVAGVDNPWLPLAPGRDLDATTSPTPTARTR